MSASQAGSATSVAKSPDAFRTISEVAEELDLPQHVLRFWETRFTQIRPLKRGGGRRLYRPDHVALLRGIKTLLYEDGMTIKGVQKVLRERGVKSVVALGRGELSGEGGPAFAVDMPERLASLKAKVGAAAPKARTNAAATHEADPRERLRQSIARLEEILDRLEGRLPRTH